VLRALVISFNWLRKTRLDANEISPLRRTNFGVLVALGSVNGVRGPTASIGSSGFSFAPQFDFFGQGGANVASRNPLRGTARVGSATFRIRPVSISIISSNGEFSTANGPVQFGENFPVDPCNSSTVPPMRKPNRETPSSAWGSTFRGSRSIASTCRGIRRRKRNAGKRVSGHRFQSPAAPRQSRRIIQNDAPDIFAAPRLRHIDSLGRAPYASCQFSFPDGVVPTGGRTYG